MYIPSSFAETDLATLHGFMVRHSFGMLVTQIDGAPFATHLPFLLDHSAGPQGTLLAHVARANPQRRMATGQTALAIFAGPHAYISPSWYEADDVVPTWNYTAVHAYGTIEVIDDRDQLEIIVAAMVREYEQSLPQPWTLGQRNAYLEKMLAQIVGLRLPITRLEGKWKLSQNQPIERREKVVRALRQQGGENAVGIADLMDEGLRLQ